MARLLLLGPAREAAGTKHDVIDAVNVGDVLDVAVARYGRVFADVLATSQVWLNGEATDRSRAVTDHDEIAVLPPVSGG